jgi:hypothetical protein
MSELHISPVAINYYAASLKHLGLGVLRHLSLASGTPSPSPSCVVPVIEDDDCVVPPPCEHSTTPLEIPIGTGGLSLSAV